MPLPRCFWNSIREWWGWATDCWEPSTAPGITVLCPSRQNGMPGAANCLTKQRRNSSDCLPPDFTSRSLRSLPVSEFAAAKWYSRCGRLSPAADGRGPAHGSPTSASATCELATISLNASWPTADEWTDEVAMTDVGINWYLNRYAKFYLNWQHANFASPVLVNAEKGRFSETNDLFWLRCQLYF